MPTDIRSRSSGTVSDSVAKRRRRSRVDSTPPRLVAGTHSRSAATTASAASGPPCGRRPMIAPKPSMSRAARSWPGSEGRLGCRTSATAGCSREPPGQLGGVALRALDPQRERAQAAQGEPHLERPGDRPVQRAVRVQPGVQVVVVGQRGAEHDVACARRGTWSRSARRRPRRARTGAGPGASRTCCRRRRARPPRAPPRRAPAGRRPRASGWSASRPRAATRAAASLRAATTAAVSSMSTSVTSMPSRSCRSCA